MLRCCLSPGRSVEGPLLAALRCVASVRAGCKNATRYFCISPFLIKVKILFTFLSFSKSVTNVGLSEKEVTQTFGKWETPCFLNYL